MPRREGRRTGDTRRHATGRPRRPSAGRRAAVGIAGEHDAGSPRPHHGEVRVGGLRLRSEEHDRATQPGDAGGRGERRPEVGSRTTAADQVVAASIERVGHEHLQGRTLLPPKAKPVRSSRLIHTWRSSARLSRGAATSGVGSTASGKRGGCSHRRCSSNRRRTPWTAATSPGSEQVGGRRFRVGSGHQPSRLDRLDERPPIARFSAEHVVQGSLRTVLAHRRREQPEDPFRGQPPATGIDVRPHPCCVDFQALDAGDRRTAAEVAVSRQISGRATHSAFHPRPSRSWS